ncbi:hypothetical protein ACH5RR_033815 [Cinchona calisaya]|uniref:Uncharacterized protein n=1 Tax=Cinchona calisaya TaxID=153742 RepID=A0ABD2YCW9_9GENT
MPRLGTGNSEDREKTETMAAQTRRDREENNTVSAIVNRIQRFIRPYRNQTEELINLGEIIDIERDIETFRNNRINIINSNALYETSYQTRLYRHYREVQIRCLEGDSPFTFSNSIT